MKLARVVVALALMSVPLAACGDEEKKGDEETKGQSKSAYVKQASAICAESQAAFDKLEETDFPVTRAALPPLFGKAEMIFAKQISDLRALDAPAADQAKVEKLLAAGDALVADFKRASKDAEFGAELFSGGGGESQAAFDQQLAAVGLKCEGEAPPKKLDPATFSAEKRAYVKQADAICVVGQKKTSPLGERIFQAGFPPELSSWAKYLPAIEEALRINIANIKQLTPPAEDKATIEALIARQDKINDQLDKAGKLAASGDEAGFTAVAQEVFPEGENAELDKDLRAYGFQVCGAND